MNIYNKSQLITLINSIPDCAVIHVSAQIKATTSKSSDIISILGHEIPAEPVELDDFDGEISIGFYRCNPS